MAVEVDICNSAVIKLGAEPFNDLSDNTKEARLCNHQYAKIRNAVLRTAPWSFAVKRALLTPAVVALEFGDENVFQLPADCVRVWKLNEGCSYKIEGGYLISNEDTAEVFYVSSAVAVSTFAADFMEAVANMLAADICYSLTQSAALKEGLIQAAEFYINQARSTNSQEQTPEDFKFNTFLDARLGGHEIY